MTEPPSGTPPDDRSWSVEVDLLGEGDRDRRARAELVADRLWGLGAAAVAELAEGLVAGFSDRAGAVAAVASLGATGVTASARADDGAWGSAWRAHAVDVAVGPFTIRTVERVPGDGDDGRTRPRRRGRVVEIDPADSFGSGHHPSTRQCLTAVATLARPGVSVLDVGTGSGILAVVASAAGAGPTVAIDLDPRAARAARANARANGVAVSVAVASLDAVRARFGLVVANLGGALAPLELAAPLAGGVGPGGTLVIGGLLEDQAPEVASAYAGLGSVTTRSEAGWACLWIERSA